MNRRQDSEEIVIKEYPHSTRWLEGQQIIGVGNLILTSRRLVFLHRVELSDRRIQDIERISKDGKTDRMIDFALTLHTKNFQIPLASVVSAGVGLHSLLPLPRPCLRISYQKKGEIKNASFTFTIPLLRGFFQFEILDVLLWVRKIRGAMKVGQDWHYGL